MATKFFRPSPITVKAADDKRMRLRIRISATTVDMQDEVSMSSAVFYGLKPPRPLIDSHDATTVRNIVGRVIETSLATDRRSVEAVVEFCDAEVYGLYRDGFATDFSIGFVGIESIAPHEIATKLSREDQALLSHLDLSKVKRIWTKMEVLEVSTCIIGACREAVTIGLKSASPDRFRAEVRQIIRESLAQRSELERWWDAMTADETPPSSIRLHQPRVQPSARNISWVAEQRAKVDAEVKRQAEKRDRPFNPHKP